MDFVPVSTDNGSPFTKPRPRYTTKFQKESLDIEFPLRQKLRTLVEIFFKISLDIVSGVSYIDKMSNIQGVTQKKQVAVVAQMYGSIDGL